MSTKDLRMLFNFLYENEDDPPETPEDPPRTFTQEEVNAFNKKERQRREAAEAKQKELEGLLKDIKNQKNLSSEEKENLQKKIEELETKNLTVEQKAERQIEKLKNEYEGKVKELTETTDSWKNRFAHERIQSSLLLAAEGDKEHPKAFNPTQIIEILSHRTELKENLDDEGQPTGEFTVVVNGFKEKDKEGNEHIISLPAMDAVNKMREMPQYANLFESDQIPGLETMKSRKVKEKPDDDLDTAEYIRRRKEGKLEYQRKK